MMFGLGDIKDMKIEELEITIDDFIGINIDNVTKNSETRTCWAYTDLFKNEVKLCKINSNEWKVFTLFEAITQFVINDEDNGQTFRPIYSKGHWRTVLPGDFTKNQLDFFSQILPNIHDPELVARISDVLWERRFGDKPYHFAELAIESYISSAELLLQSDKGQIFALERIERSITIAKIIHYKNLTGVFLRIEAFCDGEPLDEIVLIRMTEGLLKSGYIPNKKILDKVIECKNQCFGEKDYFRAGRYCGLIVDWYSATKEEHLKRSAQIEQANILVYQAEQYSDLGKFIEAVSLTKEAIVYFRNIGNCSPRLTELGEKLDEYQSRMKENFCTHEFSTDISLFKKIAITAITGKNLKDAIHTLAFGIGIPKKETIKQQIQNNQSPLLRFISREIIDDNGRTIARNSPSISVDGLDLEKALEEDMYSYARDERSFLVEGSIKPSLYQINLEHRICEDDLNFIVKNNAFIPEDRKELFKKGLLAGFNSDFIVATHILGMQIENSLRWVLNNEGVITTSLSSEGIQEEIDINRILDFPELIQIFGEDLIFDLKGLLINRFGDNLRNRIAHGLISSDEFSYSASIYFWWLTLRICAHSQIQLILSAREGVTDTK